MAAFDGAEEGGGVGVEGGESGEGCGGAAEEGDSGFVEPLGAGG